MNEIHWRTGELGYIEYSDGRVEVVKHQNMFDDIVEAKEEIDRLDGEK